MHESLRLSWRHHDAGLRGLWTSPASEMTSGHNLAVRIRTFPPSLGFEKLRFNTFFSALVNVLRRPGSFIFMTLTQRFEFISSAAAAILGLYSTPILLRSVLYTMATSGLRLVADSAARPAPSFIQEGNRGKYVPRFLSPAPVELRVLESRFERAQKHVASISTRRGCCTGGIQHAHGDQYGG
ncbi:hypothetical protein DFH08DRAFT_866943 [Mycena albidolilacea]|uniref:Uncharacterized protein n=1 Tax=Mycena albidolilacea TaxID=1033008 RepID=A0AAD7A2Y5_9AGAR|nr:hypothetical protein DFH08DRAFT_866943 [Mycena albidolilacea]